MVQLFIKLNQNVSREELAQITREMFSETTQLESDKNYDDAIATLQQMAALCTNIDFFS